MNHWVFILCTLFHSLGMARVLFGYGPFFFQFGPYLSLLLVCGLTSVPATSFCCFCHVTTRLMLARPLLCLPCTFLFIQFTLSSVSAGLILIPSWAFLVNFIPLGILDPLYSFGHPWPIPFLHYHGLLLCLLGFPDPIIISFTFQSCWPL